MNGLSAAFDTVDHGLLLEVMQKRFGVSDTALKWMESYLINRNFEIKINESSSVPITVNYSVPQGSINGPIYFTCYCSTLEQCLDRNLDIFGYADDHGIRGSCHCNSDSVQKTLSDISTSLDNIKDWMVKNRLKMNNDKTEFIVFGSRKLLPKCVTTNVQVGNFEVERISCIKLLGIHMDQNLTFKDHIAKKSRIASHAMFTLKKLCPYISKICVYSWLMP